ncbi:DedA family protein [Halothiobacillus sp. DCM-1]|uniref:DedA family protein n=1 Tax=Halothiobacillus sp. DCM-1 TaxID=3112558 RepID=UPI003252D235
MSFDDLGSFEQFAAFLQAHQRTAYALLFAGALLETLIPFSLFILGEVVFLAGAVLAGMGVLNVWGVMAALFAGGILGDNLSYGIGRRYGIGLFTHLQRWPLIGKQFHPQNYARGADFFARHGAMAVFIARLSGPLSWITPALAGIFRLDYGTFLRFNTPAVIIGISQFILVGYFFGNYLPLIIGWVRRYGWPLAALIGFILLSAWAIYRFIRWRADLDRAEVRLERFVRAHFGVTVGALIALILLIFFWTAR